MKLKINGSWVEFNKALTNLAPDVLNPGKVRLGVAGDNADRSESFVIDIHSDTEIIPGVYSSDDPQYLIDVKYYKHLNNEIVTYVIYNIAGRPDSKYVISITGITDDEIRGSFTGNYLANPFTGDVQEISEGEFVIPRQF